MPFLSRSAQEVVVYDNTSTKKFATPYYLFTPSYFAPDNARDMYTHTHITAKSNLPNTMRINQEVIQLKYIFRLLICDTHPHLPN